MPSASAGLLRFYEEESIGIKLRPEVIVGVAVALILIIVFIPFFLG